MQEFDSDLNAALKAKGVDKPSVSVFIHGSHTTFKGTVGIKFNNDDQGTLRRRLEKEWQKHAPPAPPLLPMAGSVDGGAAAAAAASGPPPLPVLKLPEGIFVELETLRPLLEHVDEQYGRHPQYHRVFGAGGFAAAEKKLKAGLHLPLALAVLRSVFPALPVRIIGNGMIKRCLSLVAVDYSDPSADPKATLAVTHAAVYQTGSGSGADMAQQFLRPSTTVDFHARCGFPNVQILATEGSWRARTHPALMRQTHFTLLLLRLVLDHDVLLFCSVLVLFCACCVGRERCLSLPLARLTVVPVRAPCAVTVSCADGARPDRLQQVVRIEPSRARAQPLHSCALLSPQRGYAFSSYSTLCL